jgi:hypothetical protein
MQVVLPEGSCYVMGVRNGLLLLIALQAALASPAAAEPLGKWALDEGAGQIATDATGGGHDGQLGESSQADSHDPAWVPGRFGSGLRFDGDRDLFISIRNPLDLLPARVTVEAWVRRLGTPGNWRYVFSSGSTECVAAPYGLYSGFGGGLAFYVSDSASYVLSPEAMPAEVWDGGWRYVVGTYDGAAVRLYVDGVEVGAGTPASFEIGYGAAATGVFIGTYRGTCSRPFSGDIDEVSVHDRALTAAQIAARMVKGSAQPLPPQGPPLAGPPAADRRPVSLVPGCLSVRVNPRRIRAQRRTRVLVTVRKGRRPAAGRRVAVRGPGLKRVVRTGPKGRARFVVRASRHGRLRLKAIGPPARCPASHITVTRSD